MENINNIIHLVLTVLLKNKKLKSTHRNKADAGAQWRLTLSAKRKILTCYIPIKK